MTQINRDARLGALENKPQLVSRWKGRITIRAEMNDMEMEKYTKNEKHSCLSEK